MSFYLSKKHNNFDLTIAEFQEIDLDYGSLIEQICYPFLEQFQPRILRRPDKFAISHLLLEEQKDSERFSDTFVRLDQAGCFDVYRKRYSLSRLM
jgi:hypothetical protein